MRLYWVLFCFSLTTVFLLVPSSCAKEAEEEPLKLPPTPVLSIRSNWGVVKSHFLRLREEPSPQAKILAHLRRGSIMQILSRTQIKEKVEGKSDFWYQVSYEGLRGWVFGAYLEVFTSRGKAETFADSLK